MKKLSVLLTNYLINNNMIDPEEYDLYYYIFLSGIQVLLCTMVGGIYALYIHLFGEYFLAIIVFLLIRSYIGGIHFESYFLCFCFSGGIIFTILWVTRHINLSTKILFLLIWGSLFLLSQCIPAESNKRILTFEEKQAYKKIFQINRILVGSGAFVLFFFQKRSYLMAMEVTLIAILITYILANGFKR